MTHDTETASSATTDLDLARPGRPRHRRRWAAAGVVTAALLAVGAVAVTWATRRRGSGPA